MKSEKGITLISITRYVIVLAIVIGVMAILSRFFYSNMNNINSSIDPITEYTKFNSFFSDEVNHKNIKILQSGTTEDGQNFIVFSNGIQYTYIPDNKAIYMNKVKIAKGVDECTFTEDIKNGKTIINVNFKAGDKERNTTYTLKN